VTPTAFGQKLRRQRERAGVTLDVIARRTNVMASLYAALEQGDCSRWPSGVIGRGFLRGYALAVGLDPDEVVADAAEHFPHFNERGPAQQPRQESVLLRRRHELRMSLDPGPPAVSWPLRALLTSTVGLVLSAATGLVGWLVSGSFWAPAAVALGLCYVAAVVIGSRPRAALARPDSSLPSRAELEPGEGDVTVLPVSDPLSHGPHLSRS
jgi:transcriptional regulator with XRE-family HTH domain